MSYPLFGQTRYGFTAVTDRKGRTGWQVYDNAVRAYVGPVHYTRQHCEEWLLLLVREMEHDQGVIG